MAIQNSYGFKLVIETQVCNNRHMWYATRLFRFKGKQHGGHIGQILSKSLVRAIEHQ